MKARALAALYPGHQALHHDLFVTFGLCPLSSSFPKDSPSPGLPAPPLTSCSSLLPLTGLSDSGPHGFSVALLAHSQLRSHPYLGLPGLSGQLWEGRNHVRPTCSWVLRERWGQSCRYYHGLRRFCDLKPAVILREAII